LAGLSGGMVGFVSVNISKFVLGTGVRGRLVGLMCALGCAAVLAGGARVIGFVPDLLIGGLLLYIGLEFLYEWLYAREFHLGDFAIGGTELDDIQPTIFDGENDDCRYDADDDVLDQPDEADHCENNDDVSRSNANSLKRRAPRLTASFHEVLIHLLANRLVLTDRLLKTLLN
jgi:hypothetical protein